MDENLKPKEEKIDNLDATLASTEEAKVEPEASAPAEVNLDNVTTPTSEEVADAGLEQATVDEPKSDDVAAPVENVEEAPEALADAAVEENGVTEMPARTFTQEELNDITGKTRVETRDKTFRYIYDRYGVKDEAGLDELVGNAQKFDSYKEQVEADKAAAKEMSDARDKELADIKEQVALMQSGIDNERYEDAKLILKGKGKDVTLESINEELASHPEWKKANPVEEKPFVKTGEPVNTAPAEPETKISVLGNDRPEGNGMSEEDMAMNMFRI